MFKINKLYSVLKKILQFFGGGQPEDRNDRKRRNDIYRERAKLSSYRSYAGNWDVLSFLFWKCFYSSIL